MTSSPADLVAVASFNLLAEAEVARSVLEADGIASFVQDRGLAAVLPPVALTSGGVRLFVAADDAERAREILVVPEQLLESDPQS
jgi:hypothetical protein